MTRDDAGYYRRRALQEQLAAQRAACSAARQRHDELATMYRFRVAMLPTDPEASLEETPLMPVDAAQPQARSHARFKPSPAMQHILPADGGS